MNKSFKKPLHLPDISEIYHNKPNELHKTIKNVSFPIIQRNSLNNTQESTIPESLTINPIKITRKASNSPFKRLLTFAKPQKTLKKPIELSLTDIPLDTSNSLNKKDLMLFWAKKRNSKRILDQLHENLWLSTRLDSLKLLTDTIYLIGDLYLCDGNLEGALYAYFHMKILCDLTQNYRMKLFAILALANCCKILKKNQQALFLYKKALEYVWKIKDEEIEAKIYDKIGMVYFHYGEIRKARYYHDRSLEFQLESDISPSKYSSSQSLEKYHESLRSLCFETITPVLLGKLGVSFNGENNSESPSFYNMNKGERLLEITETSPKVKFGTNLTIEALLENIFYEKDFINEIPSPRYPRGYSEEDILLGRIDIIGISKRPKEKKDKVAFSLNQLNLLNMNTQKNRKPIVKFDLDPMHMKIPILDKIKLRNQIIRHIKNKEQTLGSKISSKQKIKSKELLGFGIYYNHLTPNRNMEAFNYHYKSKVGKLDRYYHNLIRIEDSKGKNSVNRDSFISLETIE